MRVYTRTAGISKRHTERQVASVVGNRALSKFFKRIFADRVTFGLSEKVIIFLVLNRFFFFLKLNVFGVKSISCLTNNRVLGTRIRLYLAAGEYTSTTSPDYYPVRENSVVMRVYPGARELPVFPRASHKKQIYIWTAGPVVSVRGLI